VSVQKCFPLIQRKVRHSRAQPPYQVGDDCTSDGPELELSNSLFRFCSHTLPSFSFRLDMRAACSLIFPVATRVSLKSQYLFQQHPCFSWIHLSSLTNVCALPPGFSRFLRGAIVCHVRRDCISWWCRTGQCSTETQQNGWTSCLTGMG